MRSLLILALLLSGFLIGAQTGQKTPNSDYSKYIGKYEIKGFLVQVTLNNDALTLVVPGAPLQGMTPCGPNKFKSDDFEDSYFLFEERHGKIVKMTSQFPGGSTRLKKTSDTTDRINKGDSLLTLRKETEHFIFLYHEIDSNSVAHVARHLESSYAKILRDFNLKEIPTTVVRIYPTLKHFHEGINFPDAPANVLATAFGKADIRMTSPHSVGVEDSLVLMNNMAHEFTHCVHLNIDYAPNNPRWLWEGVAMYEADWFFDPKQIDVIKNKSFSPFASLANGLEYELGYVIIEAIKEICGFDTVIDLIRKRGDTQAVLKITQDEFEKKIYEHIYKRYIRN